MIRISSHTHTHTHTMCGLQNARVPARERERERVREGGREREREREREASPHAFGESDEITFRETWTKKFNNNNNIQTYWGKDDALKFLL